MELIDYAFKYNGKLTINGLAIKTFAIKLRQCAVERHLPLK